MRRKLIEFGSTHSSMGRGEYKRDDEHVGLGKVVNYYLLELALLGFGEGSGGG